MKAVSFACLISILLSLIIAAGASSCTQIGDNFEQNCNYHCVTQF